MLVLSLLLASPIAAAQQDLVVQRVSQPERPGQVQHCVSYGEDLSCGWELDAQGRRRAMRYDSLGAHELGAFSSFGQSSATSVNAAGQIVGWAEALVREPGSRQARLRRSPFLQEPGGPLRALPLGNAVEGWATDIGIFGDEVVGTMRLHDGRRQAWFFDVLQATTVEPFGTPLGWESEVLTTNSRPASLAFAGGLLRDPAGREFAVVWDDDRNAILVTTPGNGPARVTDVAENGTVLGWFEDALGNGQSFLTSTDDLTGPLTLLPSLGGTWTKGCSTDGFEVVGSSADASGAARAFLYGIDSGEMRDLNAHAALEPGVVLTEGTHLGFGPFLSINGTVSGQAAGFVARRLRLVSLVAESGDQVDLFLSSAPSNAMVLYTYGFRAGTTPVPGVPGLFADVTSAGWTRLSTTDALGNHQETFRVPPEASGMTVLFQGVLPGARLTTGVRAVSID